MDKYIDKLFDLIKGKSMTDVIMLLSFLYMMYTNMLKDDRQEQLANKQLEATIEQTNAIKNSNRLYNDIEKNNREFREKVLVNQVELIHLSKQNQKYLIKLNINYETK